MISVARVRPRTSKAGKSDPSWTRLKELTCKGIGALAGWVRAEHDYFNLGKRSASAEVHLVDRLGRRWRVRGWGLEGSPKDQMDRVRLRWND